MSSSLLLKHFDTISDSEKAIPRLRGFILDLAIRGKLTVQDVKDEPALDLLARIQNERSRLVVSGGLKKLKPFVAIHENEIPFSLPCGWEWTRIRQVTSDRGQQVPAGDFTYIDVTSIDKDTGRVADARILSAQDAPSRARKLVEPGDVLYSCVRPYLLNIAVLDSEFSPVPIASTAFAILNAYGLVVPRYLWLVLRSPFMIASVEAKMRGQAYPAINDSDFANLLMPLPPLPEQFRIVAKIDELMELCEGLEGAKHEREERRDLLAAASHKFLIQRTSATAHPNRVTFFIDQLAQITTRPSLIKRLRETILALAVRGQLVEQRPTEGTTVELLKNIGAENNKLRQQKRIRPQKHVPPTEAFETRTEIPGSWTHAYLQDLAYLITDGTHLTPTYTNSGKPFLSAQNVKPFRFLPAQHRFVSSIDFESYRANRRPERGDVLLTRVGAGIGEAATLDSDFEFAFYVSLCLIKVPTNFLDPRYLVIWLNSPEGRRSSSERTYGKGASQGNLNLGLIRTFKVPLPPMAEQQRIVKRVEELFSFCDRLDEQLQKSDRQSERLLDITLSQSLNTSSNLLLANMGDPSDDGPTCQVRMRKELNVAR